MSKVFSFRLDPDNPREAQAKDVIDSWVSQGYSLRQILTDALIEFENRDGIDTNWKNIFDQLSDLIRGLENNQWQRQPVNTQPALSSSFISAMRSNAKKGIASKKNGN